MSQLALQLIEKEKAEKTGYLELGNCELTPDNSQLQSVWKALGELTHLETLILSNSWFDWEKGKRSDSQNNGEKNLLDKIPAIMIDLVNLKKLVMAGFYKQWKISKLENLPQNISALDIRVNQISKLENLPRNISTLYINYNQINKLENLPQSISHLYIQLNEISKLENLPQSISVLDIAYNQTSKLENLPQSISELYIQSNKISKLENLPQNISELDISYNQISKLENLPQNISKLNIQKNQINQLENLPQSISNLNICDNQIKKLENLPPNISQLDIRDNQIGKLENLPQNISKLDIRTNKISKLENLPQNISEFKIGKNQISQLENLPRSISKLHISDNQISQLENLPQNVSELYIGKNQISKLENLPQSISKLYVNDNQISQLENLPQNISKLHISDNQISQLENLPQNISELYISGNQISKLENLPQSISHLYISENQINKLENLPQSISKLHINDNKISKLENLPQSISKLHISDSQISQLENLPQNISELRISNNKISKLENLPQNISELNIRKNQISKLENLPQSISELNVGDNQISQLENLPQSISTLYISGNQISKLENLPQSISKLHINDNKISKLENLPQNISELHINNNQISKLENLLQSTTLYIGNNQISKLENLPQSLRFLIIDWNQIKDLKPLVPFIKKGISYHVTDNPLENPPMEIVEQGDEAILRYFKELEAEGGAPLREAKLLIIGSGGVGKTSLMTKLQDPENELPAEADTTVGITVTQQPVPYQIDDESYTMNIWDFGGQDIYHPTHQFFLTKNSIYVLMEDGREQKTDFYYWLQVQELLAADSPLFILQNVKHGSRCNIPITELKGKFGNIKDYFELDLKEVTEGHAEYQRVVTELKAKLQTLPHIGEVWPRTRYAIRDTLTGMREQHYISLREYKALCREHEYTDEQGQKELLRQLHFLGVVLHFEDTPFLEDIVIVNPQWATDAVYAILNHTEKHYEKNGRFTWQDLREVWQEKKYEGKYNEILTLMSKFELSFELPDEAHTYIAPLLLPDDKPKYEWDAAANLQMEYRYDFMPKGILARLIVRLHRLIKDKLFWKRGVVFAHEHTEAEVTEDYTGRNIYIRVKGRKAKELIYWISTEIDAINASYHFSERIRARKFVPCNCTTCEVAKTPHFYDYKVLRRRIDELRKETIECQISADDVRVHGLLENIQSTKPIPSSVKSGNKKKIFISYSKHDRSNIENELKPILHPLERAGKVELFYDQDILSGDEWDAEIRAKLKAADIILLMVSSKFLATDYIWDVEIEKAIERHDAGEAKVVPIILSHCDWEDDATPFSKLNALPLKGEPISVFEDKDLAWLKVLDGIKKLL